MKSTNRTHCGPLTEQRKDEQFKRRASWQRTSPTAAGGRRQGGGERGELGPRDGVPYQTANRLPASNQRPPEILDGGHLPEGLGQKSAPQKRHKAHRTGARKLRLGPQRGEGAPHPGSVRSSSSWLPELLRLGKGQNAGPTESARLWRTRKLEPHATQGPLPGEQPGA